VRGEGRIEATDFRLQEKKSKEKQSREKAKRFVTRISRMGEDEHGNASLSFQRKLESSAAILVAHVERKGL
jgi:hypothetical protein